MADAQILIDIINKAKEFRDLSKKRSKKYKDQQPTQKSLQQDIEVMQKVTLDLFTLLDELDTIEGDPPYLREG